LDELFGSIRDLLSLVESALRSYPTVATTPPRSVVVLV